jgi:Transposase DDE domain
MILPPPVSALRQPFALETLARLPLAEAFYTLWTYLATDDILDALFAQHRGRCYQDQLHFAELVEVLSDALTRYHGSGRRAIADALVRQQLPTQARAVYGKLARLPLPLAEAFLATLTARLRPLFPAGLYRTALPTSLSGMAVVVLDGKKIKKAAKRLLATRGQPGKLYGGKILAAYLPAEGLVVALAADPDGEANDIRLVPRALPLARAAVAGPRLWVADRQFCNLDQPDRFSEGGDHYLIRHSKGTNFHPDPARPARLGTDAHGRAYTEEWGWLGAAKQGARRRYVRRIALERPGEEEVALLTDLLDEGLWPATDLLTVYLTRWQIENVFQSITEVFELRHLIGCTPQATVFQASLCLVMHNVLQVLRGYAAAAASEPVTVEALSAEQIFTDLHEELVGLHRVLAAEELLSCLPAAATADPVRARLRELLGRAWSASWRKAVNKKRRPHQPRKKELGAHTSVHKVLEAAKAANSDKQKASALSG